MAKKVRRVKKNRQKQTASKIPQKLESNEAAESLEMMPEQSISSTDQFRLDYFYVVKDLSRVLILAGAMFALLIILNLLVQ